jgi:hypothetical protein
MAENERHAAWHNQRSFAVTLLPEQGEPTELAGDFDDLLEAVDLATEWLEREDPSRQGTTCVAILESRDGITRRVWTYPPEQPDGTRGLVETFGFDPVNWVSGVREFAPERAPAAPQPAPSAQVLVPAPPAPVRESPTEGAGRVSVRLLMQASWDDRASRACLIAGAVSLWLSLTLLDLRFLALLLLALAGLWWRRHERAEATARAASEEELL